MTGPIELRNDDGRACLRPDKGGSIERLEIQGEPVLIAPPGASPTFPLVPFFSRIRRSEFEWAGRSVRLVPNVPHERDVIHGHGFKAAWRLVDSSSDSAGLEYVHAPDDWPWSYVAEQAFSLMPTGLELALSVHNTSAAEMPVGLGWHPFFPASEAEIRFRARCQLELDRFGMPARERPVERLIRLVPAQGSALDCVFLDRADEIEIRWPSHRLILTPSSMLRHLVVYKPANANFVCVEPVSNVPNGFNLASSYVVDRVQPGSAVSASLRLSFVR